MHTPFVDFLNHGTLPFVGRQEEQKRILRFWRSGDTDRSELRIGLLLGEAGSGKSRLIDETLPRIEELGGVVVHLKLRPEASTSLAPLIAMGIERSESARGLSPRQPEVTFSATMSAIRRFCSLRRTLLVIEDIHLLSGDTLREFALLLEGLADESLAILTAARPLELAARGVLESYLSEEIILDNLVEAEISEIWSRLFTINPPEEAVEKLFEATQGNALAIRSVLRSSVRSGSIVQHQQGGEWQVQINVDAFGQIARRTSHGIVDGMMADLSSKHLEAATHLALLGEAFSTEAAAVMIDNSGPMIESLIFKGIISHSTTAINALNGKQSRDLPLAFTHTLLHNALSGTPSAVPERLLSVIASDAPIYSLLPVRLLRKLPFSPALSQEELEEAIVHISAMAASIDNTPSWQEAIKISDTGEYLAGLLAPIVSTLHAREILADLTGRKLYLLRRSIASPEYKSLADDFYRQTAEGTSHTLRQLHFDAITHLFRHSVTCYRSYDRDLLDRAFEMAEGDRTIGATKHFLNLMHTLGTYALNNADTERLMLERVERAMDWLVSDTESSEEFRDFAFHRLARYFITTFDTPEQLAKRTEMAARLEKMSTPNDLNIHSYYVRFLMLVGWFDQLLERLPSLIQQSRQQGLGTYLTLHDFEAVALGLIGHDFGALLNRMKQLMTEATSRGLADERSYRISGFYLHVVALLRGDLNYAQIINNEFLRGNESLHHYNLILQRLWEGRIEELEVLADALPPEDDTLRVCMKVSLGKSKPDNDYLERHGDFDTLPVVKVFSFITIYIRLSLLDHALQQGYIPPSPQLSIRIARTLDSCLQWFAERKLHVCMIPLLDRHGRHLGEKELKKWHTRISIISEERRKQFKIEGGELLRISMIDTITVQHPGTEVHRLRGGRNQASLGLLVASAMLKKPLDRGTFFALASGVADDPERARIAWNIVATRLREAIGRETFSTSGDDIPELNLNIVHVDLLEVWELITKAEQALRHGRLVAALESCGNAISIAAGKVIFPTLYDELFETLREEFENRLRTITLGIAKALLTADDTAGAEQLLQRYMDKVTDDEEVAELLSTALDRLGRKSESVLVRGKVERAM
jgi:hypothetical protein